MLKIVKTVDYQRLLDEKASLELEVNNLKAQVKNIITKAKNHNKQTEVAISKLKTKQANLVKDLTKQIENGKIKAAKQVVNYQQQISKLQLLYNHKKNELVTLVHSGRQIINSNNKIYITTYHKAIRDFAAENGSPLGSSYISLKKHKLITSQNGSAKKVYNIHHVNKLYIGFDVLRSHGEAVYNQSDGVIVTEQQHGFLHYLINKAALRPKGASYNTLGNQKWQVGIALYVKKYGLPPIN